MSEFDKLNFIDNPIATSRVDHYLSVTVSVDKVMKSWMGSLHAFEWILPDGRIKSRDELSEKEQPKRDQAEKLLENTDPIEKPILGIGLLENIEIGSGRALFLTLASRGLKEIPVHIPISNKEEFDSFLS